MKEETQAIRRRFGKWSQPGCYCVEEAKPAALDIMLAMEEAANTVIDLTDPPGARSIVTGRFRVIPPPAAKVVRQRNDLARENGAPLPELSNG
jgi:hypothetical protein